MCASPFVMCFLTTIATYMCGAGLAQSSAVGALRDRTSLLIDVLERSIGMLTIAHTMASNAGLAGKFLAFDQHLDGRVGWGWMSSRIRVALDDKVDTARKNKAPSR